MTQPNLNWLDKTVWAISRLNGLSQPEIHLAKAVVALSLTIGTVYVYRVCWKVLGMIDNPIPFGWWGGTGILMLCCGLVYLATHSASEIMTANLTGRRRWAYTAIGLFLFPIFPLLIGLLAIWLE